MSMSDIQHQDHALDILQRGMRSDRLAHGYIFYGPDGVGKTMAAKEFGKVLLCEDRRQAESSSWQDSCDRCQSCKLVDASTHPDFHEIYKELITLIPGKERHKATELGIDVIRGEVIEKVGLHPALGRAKLFVVREADKLSRSAQNAMLKTLEEPPAGTYVVLLTERLNSLLPTTRSRAHAVRFGLLPDGFVRQRLTDAGADAARQRFFCRLAPGQLGLALELFQLGVYDLNEELGEGLAGLDAATADDFAQRMAERAKDLAEKMQSRVPDDAPARPSDSERNRAALRRTLGLIGGFYHDALRRRLGFDDNWVANIGQISLIDRIAEPRAVGDLQVKIDQVRDAMVFLGGNVNQNLLLSGLMARLAE